MDATNQRKYCWMTVVLILLPMSQAAGMESESTNHSSSIVEAQPDVTEDQPKFIITARALEQPIQLDGEEIVTLEPELNPNEDVTDEYEGNQATEAMEEQSDTTSSEPTTSTGSSTLNGLFTSTAASAYTTELPSTTANSTLIEDELVDENDNDGDLSASSSNLDIHHHRRTDMKTDAEGSASANHPVLYARLKHPLLPEESEVSVGSIFGRPYNARPLVPRTTTDSVGILFPYPSPDGDLGWSKSSGRWEKEKAENQRINMTRVRSIEAECQNDFMKIRIRFNGSFSGIIYSTGFAYDPLCVYVNGTGRDYYEFFIQLNRCGTLGGNTHNLDSRKQPTKNFMWNTLSIQYSPLIEEEWDEHYKMTCEYGYDYWKTVTFPFLDVEVATGNPLTFTLTPPECHMEIRSGYGTSGTRVTGPVRVGDPLTLVIYMRSQFDGFDVIVSDCYAHNGGSKKIQLIDRNGCPLNEKLISRFRGSWTDAGLYETQVFAYMKAFRFTGSPALYIECDVRMCHGHCPTQPCYWRNSRDISKRDVNSIATAAVNSTLSENLSLFQALQVIGDEEIGSSDSSVKSDQRDFNNTLSDQVCLRPVTIGAVLGLGSLITTILGILSCILMIRLRHRSRSESALYSHHPYSSATSIVGNNFYAKHRNF